MKKFLITSIVIDFLDTIEFFGVLAGTNEIPSNTQAYPRVNGTEVEGVVAKLHPFINNEYANTWIAENNDVEEVQVESFGSIYDYLSDRGQTVNTRWLIYIE
jgi:hypothetical protein